MRCRCKQGIYNFRRGEFYDYDLVDIDYITIVGGDGVMWFFTGAGFSWYFVDLCEERERNLGEVLGQDGWWLDVVVGWKWRAKKFFKLNVRYK